MDVKGKKTLYLKSLFNSPNTSDSSTVLPPADIFIGLRKKKKSENESSEK